MECISLLNDACRKTLEQAITEGSEPTDGIMLPAHIAPLPRAVITNLVNMTKAETAYIAMSALIGNLVSSSDMHDILGQTMKNDFQLEAGDTPHVYVPVSPMSPAALAYETALNFSLSLIRYYVSRSASQYNYRVVITHSDALEVRYTPINESDNINIIFLTPNTQTAHKDKRIKIITTDNYRSCASLYKGLMTDRDFCLQNHIVPGAADNTAGVLALVSHLFTTVQQIHRQEPLARYTTVIIDGCFPQLYVAATIASRMGLPIKPVLSTSSSPHTPFYPMRLLEKCDGEIISDAREISAILQNASHHRPVILIDRNAYEATRPDNNTSGPASPHQVSVRHLQALKKALLS